MKKNTIIAMISTIFVIVTVAVFLNYNTESDIYIDFSLTAEEEEIYKQFSDSLNDEILSNLTPLQLLKFWRHALTLEDYETQYYLYDLDREYIGYAQYINFEAHEYAMDTSRQMQLEILSCIKEVRLLDSNQRKIALPSDNNEDIMYLELVKEDDSLILFTLSKNSNGIWKIMKQPYAAPDPRRQLGSGFTKNTGPCEVVRRRIGTDACLVLEG